MALPPVSSARTSNVSSTSLNQSATESAGPRQRKNVLARMASASRSTLQKTHNFAGGLFKAKPGDASSIPRSASPVPTPTSAAAAGSLAPATPSGAPVASSSEAAPEALEMTPRLTMALENRKLVFGAAGQSNRTEQLLEGILNKRDQRYQGLAQLNQSPEKTEYLLVDAQDRLVHAHASDLALSLFKTSENRANNAFSVTMPGDAHRSRSMADDHFARLPFTRGKAMDARSRCDGQTEQQQDQQDPGNRADSPLTEQHATQQPAACDRAVPDHHVHGKRHISALAG